MDEKFNAEDSAEAAHTELVAALCSAGLNEVTIDEIIAMANNFGRRMFVAGMDRAKELVSEAAEVTATKIDSFVGDNKAASDLVRGVAEGINKNIDLNIDAHNIIFAKLEQEPTP